MTRRPPRAHRPDTLVTYTTLFRSRRDARGRASRITPDSRNLAIFDDVVAERIGGAGIAPGDRAVPRRAPAPLKRSAHHRVPHLRIDIERRTEFLRLPRRQPFIVHAVDPVVMHMHLEQLHVLVVFRTHPPPAPHHTQPKLEF